MWTDKLQFWWSEDVLVVIGTYRKAGEDIRSCSHTNANHTVDPAEETPVTDRLEMNSQFLYIIIDRLLTGSLLKLSQHRGQHFSHLLHGWVAITGDR